MYIKCSEIKFQGYFGRTHFCVRTLEKFQTFEFRTDVQNQHFSVRMLYFVLKMSTIGQIMHRNAIKHEQ